MDTDILSYTSKHNTHGTLLWTSSRTPSEERLPPGRRRRRPVHRIREPALSAHSSASVCLYFLFHFLCVQKDRTTQNGSPIAGRHPLGTQSYAQFTAHHPPHPRNSELYSQPRRHFASSSARSPQYSLRFDKKLHNLHSFAANTPGVTRHNEKGHSSMDEQLLGSARGSTNPQQGKNSSNNLEDEKQRSAFFPNSSTSPAATSHWPPHTDHTSCKLSEYAWLRNGIGLPTQSEQLLNINRTDFIRDFW